MFIYILVSNNNTQMCFYLRFGQHTKNSTPTHVISGTWWRNFHGI